MKLLVALGAPLLGTALLLTAGCGASSDGNAIALLGSQIRWSDSIDEIQFNGAIPTNQPDTLYVLLGDAGRSCEEPFIENAVKDIDCGTFWRVNLALQPSQQKAGPTALVVPGIANGFLQIREDPSGGCVLAGGSFTSGSLDIVSIDDTQVVLKLQGAAVAGSSLGFDPDGEYTATRCP